ASCMSSRRCRSLAPPARRARRSRSNDGCGHQPIGSGLLGGRRERLQAISIEIELHHRKRRSTKTSSASSSRRTIDLGPRIRWSMLAELYWGNEGQLVERRTVLAEGTRARTHLGQEMHQRAGQGVFLESIVDVLATLLAPYEARVLQQTSAWR